MKKLRVFQTVKNRRIVSGFPLKNLGTVLLLLLAVPYLVTFLFGNLGERDAEDVGSGAVVNSRDEEQTIFVRNVTGLGSERIPLELYVGDKLARSIDNDYEVEALKAQAVLIRSGIVASGIQVPEAGEGRETEKQVPVLGEILVKDEEYGSLPVSEKIWQAVSESAGVCLFWSGQPVSGAYFAVSSGRTRNGGELSLTEYPYLKGVECSRDFMAEDYLSYESYEAEEFMKIWQQIPEIRLSEQEREKKEALASLTELEDFHIYKDSAGYVVYVEEKEKCVSGEQFREAFLLSSPCFHLEREGAQILFTVKGAGHGLGMSQFAANEMAKEDKDYIEILEYFFDDVTITKIE